MRILHLTRNLAPRASGGLSTAVLGMVRASYAHGLTVAAVSFDGHLRHRQPAQAAQPESGVDVLRLSHLEQTEALGDFVRRINPDLVHVHHATLWPTARALRLPTVFSVHVLHRAMNQLRNLTTTRSADLQELALDQADAIVAPSQHVASLVDGAHFVGLGVESPTAAPPPMSRRSPTVLYAGRFSDIKGTEVFFDMVDQLVGVGDLSVEVAGGLPENLKSQRRWLKQLPEHPRVSYLGWQGTRALVECYRRARVVVCPSRFETFGQVIAEAQAQGAVVVARDIPVVRECIEPGKTGVLVAADVDFAQVVLDLAGDIDTLSRMADAARKQVPLWPPVVARLCAVYASIRGR